MSDNFDNSKITLRQHIHELYHQNHHIRELEEQLKEAKEKRNNMSKNMLPELLTEIGIDRGVVNIGTDNSPFNVSFDVKDVTVTKIPDGSKNDAIRWLVDNNYGEYIKCVTTIRVNEVEKTKEAIKKIKEILNSIGISFTQDTSIHQATLSSIMRKAISSGVNVPMDIFGVSKGAEVKLKTLRE